MPSGYCVTAPLERWPVARKISQLLAVIKDSQKARETSILFISVRLGIRSIPELSDENVVTPVLGVCLNPQFHSEKM
jgi:hypothetical protein